MKKILSALTMALAATSAQAAQYSIPQGTLVCVSEQAYDEQIQYAVQGVDELVDGCGFTKADFPVVMLDYNVLSASKAKIISNGLVVFVAGEHLAKH